MEAHINKVIPVVTMLVCGLAATAWGASHCQSTPAPPMSDVVRGRQIYENVCLQCHNTDPNRDGVGGTPGPPIADSSMELLRLRVLTTKYPEGYTPKRDTQLMTPFPDLEPYIPQLYAYLQSVVPPGAGGSKDGR